MKLNFPCEISVEKSKFLLAISGGVDSMVLLDLFSQKKLNFAVAHMNFGLREAADEDENFIKKIAQNKAISFFSKKVDTLNFKKENSLSTQMAARELRYAWFDELCKKYDFDYTVTAHHANDQVETFFLNLLRGSGAKGLSGMQTRQGKILRPLLSIKKEDILAYAKNHQIAWREDATNQTNDYLRNAIRNQLIPILNEIKSNAEERILQSMNLLEIENQWINERVSTFKGKFFKPLENQTFSIPIAELKNLKPIENTLHYLFYDFGFGSAKEIEKLLSAENSSEIQSDKFRLIKNRKEILLKPLEEITTENIYKVQINKKMEVPLPIFFQTSDAEKIKTSASFDYKSLKFPLYLRSKKMGDRFFPAGMGGKSKKVSKYLKDEKFSKLEKEKTLILVDANDEILWIVGHRQDERFLPHKNTKVWLHVDL